MNIEIPDALSESLSELASRRGMSSAEQYVLTLIEEDKARDRVEALLLEGLESGEPIEATAEFWEEHKRRFLDRFPDAVPFV